MSSWIRSTWKKFSTEFPKNQGWDALVWHPDGGWGALFPPHQGDDGKEVLLSSHMLGAETELQFPLLCFYQVFGVLVQCGRSLHSPISHLKANQLASSWKYFLWNWTPFTPAAMLPSVPFPPSGVVVCFCKSHPLNRISVQSGQPVTKSSLLLLLPQNTKKTMTLRLRD